MLEVTYGLSKNPEFAAQLVDALSDQRGSLYLAFPLLPTDDETITVDALLLSDQLGVIAFVFEADIYETNADPWEDLVERQDRVYVALEDSLRRHSHLRTRRKLAFPINIVTVLPVEPQIPSGLTEQLQDVIATSIDNLKNAISNFRPINSNLRQNIESALQGVATLHNKYDRNLPGTDGSRGHILSQIEQQVAILDFSQKQAAIETVKGPQRIRGLAGSGKTIVLAYKAAYLHANNPDWTIAITFYSRALYQQFKDLIRRFSFGLSFKEPNWDRLRVCHSWGGMDGYGLYAQIANSIDAPIRDFGYGRSKFGSHDAFEGICKELLATVSTIDIEPIFDVVLIDEAQDLPPSFFQLVYKFTRGEKRIIWAYDELQRLSETSMPTLEQLFGSDEQANPLVVLENREGEPREDIVLKTCYRNPAQSLTVAHALGLGIYRREGQVQGFDDPNTWSEIGYDVLNGKLAPGSQVELKRGTSSHAPYFDLMLQQPDIVQTQIFADDEEQSEWIAESVEQNIRTDGLSPEDILIILPDSYWAKRDSVTIAQKLEDRGIRSHLAGVTSSQDTMFHPQSVAMAHIHRSKGNEAGMVYIAGAQRCLAPTGQISRRNILFTAITRSRAWVRICGVGTEFASLVTEVKRVIESNYQLNFKLLTSQQLESTRVLHRDLNPNQTKHLQTIESHFRDWIKMVKDGNIPLEALPHDVREELHELVVQPKSNA